MTNFTPSALSTATKIAAQFIQKTRWVMNLQTEITQHEQALENLEKDAVQVEKRLAITVFKHEQAVKNEDPRVENSAKLLKDGEKYAKEDLDEIEKNKTDHTKAVEQCEKDIEEIENGKKKVSSDKTVEIAKTLVTARIQKEVNNGEFDA